MVSQSIVRNVVFFLFVSFVKGRLVKGVIQGFYRSKLMGPGTHSSDFDGFLGTHGTHANGATVIIKTK